jgi:uncharacterized membrane protein YjgN (DUF898 family)
MSAIAVSLPYATAVLLSTAPILALVLLLIEARPVKISAMFPLGWFLGVVVVLSAAVALADVSTTASERPLLGGVLRIVLGVFVAFLALQSWKTRTEPPKWIGRVARWSALRAFTTGFMAGSINPKNLALIIAGATAVLGATTVTHEQLVAVISFATIASLGVLAPVLLQATGGETIQRHLQRAAQWMASHGKTLSTIVLAVIAVLLIVTGLTSVSGRETGKTTHAHRAPIDSGRGLTRAAPSTLG